MKKGKWIGIVLAVVNVALIMACVVLYLGEDRKKPRFEFQASDVVYREGMDISGLLEGISAFDQEDGDVTDRIVVEKWIENREENLVIVFYAVTDKAGNVAKCSRECPAVFAGGTEEDDLADIQGEWMVQSGFWKELEGGGDTGGDGGETEGEGTEKEETGEKGSEGGKDGEEEYAGEADRGNENGLKEAEEEGKGRERPVENGRATDPDTDRGNAEADTDQGNAEADTEREDAEEPQNQEEAGTAEGDGGGSASAPPVLSLNVSEIRTSVGIAPAWVEVIGSLSDDVDSYETLFRNLEVSKYNINQAGTYQVTVSTKDSDGNRSQAVPLTIIVK